MNYITVNLTPREAADIVSKYVMSEGMSTKFVDSWSNASGEGREAIMLVYEKYYMRNSSRASLSVMIENLTGLTNVCAIGSGGGQGAIFDFDWGAADQFESLPSRALRDYVVHGREN